MVMYKIDRRGGAGGGVQKSYIRTDPTPPPLRHVILTFYIPIEYFLDHCKFIFLDHDNGFILVHGGWWWQNCLSRLVGIARLIL